MRNNGPRKNRTALVPPILGNYFKIGLRKVRRQKGYSFINIAGLAVGLAACILIVLWVRDETSFDRHHEKAARIYRLAYNDEIAGVASRYALAPFIAATAFAAEVPEIETCARLLRGSPLAVADGKTFDLTDAYYTDPAYFQIFSHTFLSGDPQTALAAPGSIVLTETTARKLFDRADVTGATVNFNRELDLRVTGVIRDLPPTSHFLVSCLVSLATIQGRPEIRQALESWGRITGWSYVLLRPGADPGTVERKMAAVGEKQVGERNRNTGTKMEFRLQPLQDIYLKSRRLGEIGPTGDIRAVYAFTMIAGFILVIACINFMNLATARSAVRAREVGLRKVLGARRKSLVVQFLGESFLMSFLATALAAGLSAAVLSPFNRLTGKALGFSILISGTSLATWAGLALLAGLLAGSYPAFFLSAFRPAAGLKSGFGKGRSGTALRSGLVVFQFSISIFLMAGTLIVLSQLRYMKNRDLGFDQSRVLVVRMNDPKARRGAEALVTELKRNLNIAEASLTGAVPGGRLRTSLVVSMEGRPETESFDADVIWSDFDFARTYGIPVVRGRDFSKAFPADAAGAFLVNETAARKMGWEGDAVGRRIGFDADDLRPIVGILKDFHFTSLASPIGPLVVRLLPPAELAARAAFLSLKLRGGPLRETVAFVKSVWAERSERGFVHFFADENFETLYRNEERLGRIITAFAVMAVFVACLGLFGLASFAAERRTKEIGVRKVLGASEAGLAALLSKQFLKWVLAANALSLPAAYWVMSRLWLSNFAYRTSPGVLTFAAVAALSIFIALITVSGQAVRAALANPVDSLRYE